MNIKMEAICKSFGSNQVLHNAAFELCSGEIHALMGENGAGKSTLMKILTGVYKKDGGIILIDGQPIQFQSAQQAEKSGIVFIHQELNVIFDLTVEENLFLGKEITSFPSICDKKSMIKKAQEFLNAMEVNISATARVSDLSVGQQQMVEICKALMVDAKVLIMDEPTAALTQRETTALFRMIKALRKKGVSIVYISHRMEEIFELCDRITVLRDGEYAGTERICDVNMDKIVHMMIGREIGERYPKRNTQIGNEVLRVENLSHRVLFRDITFDVKSGEILGVSGLMGAGRTQIMQTIFGVLPSTSGKIMINGKEVRIHNPKQAIDCGIGFITEDRKTEGLLSEKSVAENIALPNLSKISKNGIVIKRKLNELAQSSIREYHIRCFNKDHVCGNLSGGNQQKVILAKWVYTEPKILILDEPTRGVDIGAKKEIYNVINDLANKGVAIILVSSELPELLGMSDRIMVIHEGRVAGILPIHEANQARIMTLATGGHL